MNMDTLEIAQVLTTGTVMRIGEDGAIFVGFTGLEGSAVRARLALSSDAAAELRERTPVLILFEAGDPGLPVIIGILRDRLPVRAIEAGGPHPPEVRIDGRQLHFTATDQVVIECGHGSITLSSDGSIEIKGSRISSRSSGVHKIRGASVRIN
jgi:hypothetical protein